MGQNCFQTLHHKTYRFAGQMIICYANTDLFHFIFRKYNNQKDVFFFRFIIHQFIYLLCFLVSIAKKNIFFFYFSLTFPGLRLDIDDYNIMVN